MRIFWLFAIPGALSPSKFSITNVKFRKWVKTLLVIQVLFTYKFRLFQIVRRPVNCM